MKVIFLDIDGVLNTPYDYVEPKDRPLRNSTMWNVDDIFPKYVERLNKIIATTGAKVVISSSWRRLHPMSAIIKMLKYQGFNGHVIDKTPQIAYVSIAKGKDRGDEVKEWLDSRDDVESFVILDDLNFENFLKYFPNQFIFVNGDKGLSDDDVKKAINILTNTK